jgi:hypothetical protein
MKGNYVRFVPKPKISVREIIIHQLQELRRYDSDCGSGRMAKMIVADVKAFTCVG